MTEENIEDLMRKELDFFEEEITLNKENYAKIREFLSLNQYLEGHANNGGMIYLTNHLNPNQMPYSIILSSCNLKIQKNHPLGEQIKKDLSKWIN